MKEKQYIRILSEDSRVRVKFGLAEGEVKCFSVQLEIQKGEIWNPVVRYDTAHGFPHKDVLQAKGKWVKIPFGFGSLGLIWNWALTDISQNWMLYRDRYLSGG